MALKVLPARTLADETARKRFRKEALALSKLNHPNIATIYDFDTQDGVDFLVMEYVEGTTLSEKLSNGPLVTKLGRQVADALEEAHERGVIQSRPEAGQRDGDGEGPGQGARLRPGEAGAPGERNGCDREPHRNTRRSRDAALHGSGAVAGAGG